MSEFPKLSISLAKITHNSKVVTSFCSSFGIDVFGVTKGVLGMPEVGKAMVEGGATGLADSRIPSLRQLKKEGASSKLMMLRQPMAGEVDDALEAADIILVSQLEIAKHLSERAKSYGKNHKVILMIETGDLREGLLKDTAISVAENITKLSNIEVVGVGTNVACLNSASPTSSNLKILVETAYEIEKKLGLELKIISGGNSSAWKLLEKEAVPKRINQLRIGEGILLGQETIDYTPIPSTYQDAFIISAEALEVKEVFLEGKRKALAVLALGLQDIGSGYVKPLLKDVKVLKVSSDHGVLDISRCEEKISAGKIFKFIPSYFALLASITSPFVAKAFV